MLSPAAAAKRAGCGRTSIMRALESKSLSGIRDNRNRWKISVQVLDEWAKSRPDTDRSEPVTSPVTHLDNPGLLAQIAAAQATIDGLEARLADTQAERDRLAQLLDKAMSPQPSLWSRIWPRS